MWAHRIYTNGANLSYWQGQSVYSDTQIIDVGPLQLGASRATMTWSRTTPAGTQEDLVTINPHFAVAPTPGAPTTILSNADKDNVANEMQTFCTSVAAKMTAQFTTANLVWHDIFAGDVFYGPADRITPIGVGPGLIANNRLPDQCALTITMKTASRRHWGRVYVPGVAFSQYDAVYGRPTNAMCDTLASAW